MTSSLFAVPLIIISSTKFVDSTAQKVYGKVTSPSSHQCHHHYRMTYLSLQQSYLATQLMALMSILYVTIAIIIIVSNKNCLDNVGVAFHHSGIVVVTTYNPLIILIQHSNYTGMDEIT